MKLQFVNLQYVRPDPIASVYLHTGANAGGRGPVPVGFHRQVAGAL